VTHLSLMRDIFQLTYTQAVVLFTVLQLKLKILVFSSIFLLFLFGTDSLKKKIETRERTLT